MTEALNDQYAALHAERVRTMDPEKLAKNIAQRQALVDAFEPAKAVHAGEIVAPFDLLCVDGGVLSLDDLVANGPAVLIFFRFATCPACNLALPYYQRTLWPTLEARGVRLVAISPQVPERLIEIRKAHGLGFSVASDPGNRLATRFGLTFEPDAATRGEAGPGWIGEVTGTGTWELPQPAVVIIDQDRTVRFADISPDWMVRTESHVILEALGELRFAAAA